MTRSQFYHSGGSADSGSESLITCKHCGLPVNSVCEPNNQFCCVGCATVYRLIHEQGLQKFYELKEQGVTWKNSPARLSDSTYLHFDDPNFMVEYTRSEGQLSSVVFFLEGIHCSACVWLLEKVPLMLNGVFQITVNISRSEILVKFDPKVARLSALAATLNSLGYRAFPLKGAEGENLRRASERRLLYRIGVALFCAVGVMFIADARYQGIFSGIESHFSRFFVWFSLVLTTPVVFYSAVPFYRTAFGGLRSGRLHIDLPVAIAIIGAYIPSLANTILGNSEVYFDSICDLVFLLLSGRYIQSRGLAKAADASELLYSISPIEAKRVEDGVTRSVYVASLALGDVVEIGKDQIVPADGTIIEGHSHMNFSVLTGESVPRKVQPGEKIFCGVKNLTNPLRMHVEAFGADTRLGRIMKSIESAQQEKAPIVEITDRISVYFVFAVLLLALAAVIVWAPSGFYTTLDKVIALLVVTCPCALGLATPVALSVAIAKASRSGIVIHSADVFERTAQVNEIAFDKTGTLTLGVLSVKDIFIEHHWQNERKGIFQAISLLEYSANHPAGRSLAEYVGSAEDLHEISADLSRSSKFSSREIAGKGVEGEIALHTWRIGSLKWFSELGISISSNMSSFVDKVCQDGLGVVLVACDGSAVAAFSMGDLLRPEAFDVIERLRGRGLKITLLSGDLKSVAHKIGRQVGIAESEILGELSPEEKADYLKGKKVAFVGDGINDASALKAAHLGISVRGGAEVSVKVSDVFLAREGLWSVCELFEGAQRALKLVYINLGISLAYNAVGAGLAFIGYIGPLIAAILMPISSITVIATAVTLRTFQRNRWR